MVNVDGRMELFCIQTFTLEGRRIVPILPHIICSMFCAARAFRGANQFGFTFPV